VVVAAVGVFVWPGHVLSAKTVASTAPAAKTASAPTPTTGASPAAAVSYSPGTALPAAVPAVCARLVAATAAEQRSALTPQLAATLPAGPMFPAGTSLTMQPDSWHQAGDFANAFGELTEPGQPATQVQIGFALQASGGWLVDFEEAAS
jgi:hypothetical protein